MKKYTRDDLPSGKWRFYRKRRDTLAIHIDRPFWVETREGTLTCSDGYLALDSENYPYPIAKDEFEKIYTPVEDCS